MRNHNEDNLQKACVKWFRLQYPDVVIFAIPNGGQRDAVTGALMKATGTLAGVADLFVMKPKQYYEYSTQSWINEKCGLFIEMKAGKGKQTEAQIWFQEHAEKAGYKYAVCRSFDEFKTVIENYI